MTSKLSEFLLDNNGEFQSPFNKHLPLNYENINKDAINVKTVADYSHLHNAFLNVIKKKRTKGRILNLTRRVGSVLSILHHELLDGTYEPSSPFIFTIQRPKLRVIASPAVRDSIVQHSIYKVVYPIFDRSFIYDSYGCRLNKGTHKASDRCQYFMRQCAGNTYNIQIDIKGYYFNINHDILRSKLSQKINDIKLLNLMMMFVNRTEGIGLGVGNLLSQLYGLIYLNSFDHYVKRNLKVDRYIRYVDDMVFIGIESREKAELILAKVEEYLYNELGLTLSKWKITKNSTGLNFVGFRTWRSSKHLRKHSFKTFKKCLRNGDIESIISILGNAKNTSSFNYLIELLNQNKRIKNDIKIQSVCRTWNKWIYD